MVWIDKEGYGSKEIEEFLYRRKDAVAYRSGSIGQINELSNNTTF